MTSDKYIAYILDRRNNNWWLEGATSLTTARKNLPRWDEDAGEYHSFYTVRWATKADVSAAKAAGKVVPAAYTKG